MIRGRSALGDRQTAALIFAIGAAVALAGDAGHVAAGTTTYEWDGVPEIWRSAIWFPVIVGAAVLAAAWAGRRYAGQPAKRRNRADALTGIALVLALYSLTGVLRGQSDTISVVLVSALAVAIFSWWDPTPGTFRIAAVAAVAGPVGEIVVTAIGAASYAPDSDQFFGVAPWLPALYFAAGAVAARLWRAIDRDGR